MQIKLSVVIITFNEEKNIERCIASVKEIADEIVVVDSFSTDQTPELCRQAGVHFVQHAFEGHIEQKNFAITQASYPHILSLDADEALDIQLTKQILTIKQNWDTDGYSMNRLTNYCGKWIRHGGWYPDTKLRLWDSRKGKWGGVNPHDRFELDTDTRTKHLKGDILHYSFYTISQHIQQIDKFSEIRANALFEAGKKSSIFKLLFSPFFTFLKMYFLKMGCLDGFYGLVVCMSSAYAKFLRYAKLRDLQKHS